VSPVTTRIVSASVVTALVSAATYVPRAFMRRREANAVVLNDTLPVHSKWWREQIAVSGEIVYVAIGDSAAQGIGASEPGKSYVGLLAEHIREETKRTVHIINLSISGARVADAVDLQLPKLEKLKPDIITVSVGANDIGAFDPARFERDVRALLTALPRRTLVADVPSFYFPDGERKVKAANRIVHRIATANGHIIVPLYRTTHRQGLPRALTQVAGDFFHPNDRGYRVWASAFLPLLDRSISKLA
jgi:lysophospholipase L1-like esterase